MSCREEVNKRGCLPADCPHPLQRGSEWKRVDGRVLTCNHGLEKEQQCAANGTDARHDPDHVGLGDAEAHGYHNDTGAEKAAKEPNAIE